MMAFVEKRIAPDNVITNPAKDNFGFILSGTTIYFEY
jgi:hypothetical protein